MLGVLYVSDYPFDDTQPPSVEELRYIANKLRESDSGIFPKSLCEQYADIADQQADSIERFFEYFETTPTPKDGVVTFKITKP